MHLRNLLLFIFISNACVFCKSDSLDIPINSDIDLEDLDTPGKDILFLESVVPTTVKYGSKLILQCQATLVDKSYQLFHIWLFQSDVPAKIAAFFPFRDLHEREYVSPNEQRLYQLEVKGEIKESPVNSTYTLTATFPSITCAHQTSFYCWAFAYPSPQPLQTTPKHVNIPPCSKMGHGGEF